MVAFWNMEVREGTSFYKWGKEVEMMHYRYWWLFCVYGIPEMKLLRCCSRRHISSWGTCWQQTVTCPVPRITIDKPWRRIRSMLMQFRRCASLLATRSSTAVLRLLSQLLNLRQLRHSHSSQLVRRLPPNPVKLFSSVQRSAFISLLSKNMNVNREFNRWWDFWLKHKHYLAEICNDSKSVMWIEYKSENGTTLVIGGYW